MDTVTSLFVILIIFIAYTSPVIAGICYLSSFFAWYYELKEKSIVFLMLGILFTIIAIYVYGEFGHLMY